MEIVSNIATDMAVGEGPHAASSKRVGTVEMLLPESAKIILVLVSAKPKTPN